MSGEIATDALRFVLQTRPRKTAYALEWKPCALKAHALFDEEGQENLTRLWIMRHHRTKGAETDRSSRWKAESCSLLYPIFASV